MGKVNKIKMSIKYFSLFFISLFLITFIILIFVESKIAEVQSTKIEYEEYLILTMGNKLISDIFETSINDIEYLCQTFDEENNDIKDFWKIFSSKNKIYDQIRFIDKDGNEKIRVNYGKENSTIVQNSYLRNIKNENYFKQTANLKEGEIFISKLDLNNIEGDFKIPSIPLMYFCTPVYDNGFKGIIVLNYNTQHLIDKIRDVAVNSNGRVYLVNEKGDCLSRPDDDWLMGVDDKVGVSFAESYPEEWNDMNEQESNDMYEEVWTDIYEEEWYDMYEAWEDIYEEGFVVSENGLFTYIIVDIINNLNIHDSDILFEEGMWSLVSVVEDEFYYGGYYVSDNLSTIIKHIISTKYYFLIYIIIISLIITKLVIKNKLFIQEIKYVYEFDPMTDVYNRRSGFIRLGKYISDIMNIKYIALCFIDVNGLKEVNDKFGHKVGDELILDMVKEIKENIRDNDFIIRLGGDEFLMVLPKTQKEDAEKVWDRITKSLEEINITEKRPYLISASHGMAEINSIINEDGLEKLITQADDKMYEEKRIIKKNIKIIR